MIVPLLPVFRTESATEHGLDSKYIEEIRRCQTNADLPRLAEAGHLHLGGSHGSERLERRGLFLQERDMSARDPRSGDTNPSKLCPQESQLARVFVGQRPEQYAVDESEYCRCRADADCQRQDDDGGKGRLPLQRADSIANVLCEHRGHRITS